MRSVKLLGRKDPTPFPQHAVLPNRFGAPLRPRLSSGQHTDSRVESLVRAHTTFCRSDSLSAPFHD